MSDEQDRLPSNYCPTCGAELEATDGPGVRCPEHGRLIVTVTGLSS